MKAYLGWGHLSHLSEVLREVSPRRIFFVHGMGSFESCGAKDILKSLLKPYSVFDFTDFSSNPKMEDVQRGIESFRRFKPDLVLAVGGGTALDVAKSINLLANQKEDPELYAMGKASPKILGLPLIALPTTAGTGSEATHFAVLYVEGTKYSLTHPSLLPNFAIVDPSLTMSMSPRLTAETGMDALSQAIEAYWSVKATPESREYSIKALGLIIPNYVLSVKSPTQDARTAMSFGAHYAGRAINIAGTTAAHAMSYYLTSHYNIPHGHAVGVLLPAVLEANQNSLEDLTQVMGVSGAMEARKLLEGLMDQVGLERSLRGLGVGVGDLKEMAATVDQKRLSNNPRQFSDLDLLTLLQKLFEQV